MNEWISGKPSSRLPLLSAMTVVTFPASKRHQRLPMATFYTAPWTEADVRVNELPWRCVTAERPGFERAPCRWLVQRHIPIASSRHTNVVLYDFTKVTLSALRETCVCVCEGTFGRIYRGTVVIGAGECTSVQNVVVKTVTGQSACRFRCQPPSNRHGVVVIYVSLARSAQR